MSSGIQQDPCPPVGSVTCAHSLPEWLQSQEAVLRMRDVVLVRPGANDTEDFTALVFLPAQFILFSKGCGIPSVLVVRLDELFSLLHPWA